MRWMAILLVLLIIPTVLPAQGGPWSVGGGMGVSTTAGENSADPDLSGSGSHVRLTAPLMRLGPQLALRVELFHQRAEVTGSPFSCERVDQFYCLGRRDEHRLSGLGLQTFFWFGSDGDRGRFYLAPVGVGVYRRATVSREFEGPTGICVEDQQIVPCTNNPSFGTYEMEETAWGVGVSTGVGAEVRLGPARVFAEARLLHIREAAGSVGAIPFTIGLSF